ncbi:MAG TPA: PstS family phosphate ABC transporter substrate-binding protein [Solirubrobacter sp.]|nr:PstS family phosphate ABC transporter substrate-binding protein [Solirubrobacter sp.]
MRIRMFAAVAAALSIGVAACGGEGEAEPEGAPAGADQELSGTIRIDGSSTVFPFAEAAGELFNEEQPSVQVTVGQSGTGGGFEKFCAGETDISNASRPIKADEEVPVCERNGVKFEEIQVANDGIAVVTNRDTGIECLTVDQLNAIWEPGSKVARYSDAGEGLPSTPVKLFGPGTDSGTFDFFTDVINGEEGASREDYEASEDDNQLVTGVSGTPGGLGYFGFSYYEANADKLNLVGVGEDAASCKKPDPTSIQDGSYKPLSRPLFMYPSDRALQRPEVKAFMEFVVSNYTAIADAAKFVALTDAQASEAKAKVDRLAGVQ